ncbi:hypothetical protein ACFLSZ_06160 [Candidatus Bipolaricaulota bacterium]
MTVESNRDNQWEEIPELRGPWLGQEAPGTEPVKFCPEIFSAKEGDNRVAGIVFGPEGEEAFFTMNPPSGGNSGLMQIRMVDGIWTKPQPAPFNAQIDNDICLSPDGRRVCWRSWRPLPGMTAPEERPSLWLADRTDAGWGEPFPVQCDGELQNGWYPGIAASGTLYFSAQESPDEYCVYRAKRVGDQYEMREVIIRGMKSGGDLCVAPDESFLVVTCFSLPHFKGVGNLHVSFQTSTGEWTPLLALGSSINTELLEYCPTISAEGRRLFFCRLDRETRQASAYWVDTRLIDELK